MHNCQISPTPEFKLSVGPVETCLPHMIRISSHPPTYKISSLLFTPIQCSEVVTPHLHLSVLSKNISVLSQSFLGRHSHLITYDEIKCDVFIITISLRIKINSPDVLYLNRLGTESKRNQYIGTRHT